MATITTVSHGSYMQPPRRTYLTTADFNGYIYKIEKTGIAPFNEKEVITPMTGIVAPKGHYLRENGKKIVPGQYYAPDGVTVNQNYYVGVYDDSTFTSGYINPNSKVFIPLNTDKPVTIQDDLAVDQKDGNVAQGPPVNTFGYVASGVIPVADTNGGGSNRNACIDATQGNTFLINPPSSVVGNVVYVYFATDALVQIIPPKGSVITLVFTGKTTGNYTVILNQSIPVGQYVYARGDLAVYKDTYSTVTFISDGTALREIARSVNEKNDTANTGKALSIIHSGTGTTNGSRVATVSTSYAYDKNKIILQCTGNSSTLGSISVSGGIAGSNFTVESSVANMPFSWFILG